MYNRTTSELQHSAYSAVHSPNVGSSSYNNAINVSAAPIHLEKCLWLSGDIKVPQSFGDRLCAHKLPSAHPTGKTDTILRLSVAAENILGGFPATRLAKTTSKLLKGRACKTIRKKKAPTKKQKKGEVWEMGRQKSSIADRAST
jgi:hypothetical protein